MNDNELVWTAVSGLAEDFRELEERVEKLEERPAEPVRYPMTDFEKLRGYLRTFGDGSYCG